MQKAVSKKQLFAFNPLICFRYSLIICFVNA